MADIGGINAIISRAVQLLCVDSRYGPRLTNCWLSAATWVEALTQSGHIDGMLVIPNARKFNMAMSKSILFGESMTHFDGSNLTGCFRVTYRKQFFYYLTEKTRQIAYPSPLNSAWEQRALQAGVNALAIPSTRARPRSCLANNVGRINTTDDGAHTSSAVIVSEIIAANESPNESPNKRQRVDYGAAGGVLYWPESPEAYQLFKPSSSGSLSTIINETPQEAVERRIKLLQSVYESEDSWRNVVKGGDADNFCTKSEVFEIRQRATFLCCAYQLALKHMNQWTWHDCCKEACKCLNSFGMNQATFFKTLAQWNIVFRTFECFPHPNPYVQSGKRPLPRLLEIFPDAKDQIVAFGIKNLATLTIEGVQDFIVTTSYTKTGSVMAKGKM
jgi:hypothetical protein